MNETTFHNAGPVDDFPVGRGRTVTIEGRAIAVFNLGGRLRAVDGLCPHQHADLTDGNLEGTILTCSRHGWSFDIETGRSPREHQPGIRTYPTRVENGVLRVGLPVSSLAPGSLEDEVR